MFMLQQGCGNTNKGITGVPHITAALYIRQDTFLFLFLSSLYKYAATDSNTNQTKFIEP